MEKTNSTGTANMAQALLFAGAFSSLCLNPTSSSLASILPEQHEIRINNHDFQYDSFNSGEFILAPIQSQNYDPVIPIPIVKRIKVKLGKVKPLQIIA